MQFWGVCFLYIAPAQSLLLVCVLLQKREQELLELSKTVNQTRSRMDVAQSELDIYLSQHNTAVSQLNQAKTALQEAVDTLRERRAAIKDLSAKIPRCEEQLKKVCVKMLLVWDLCGF